MNLYDLVDPDDLARGITDKFINIRESNDGCRIYNYSDAALYTPGAWDNPAVRQCRGLIVNSDDRIIARPWAKFFNHGQTEAGDLAMYAPVEVTDKLDGSLGIIHRDSAGQVRVATRGSFESDQAIHATDWLRGRGWDLRNLDRVTLLAEIIYPGNRIVCDYGATDDLILLGAVDIATGTYWGPTEAVEATEWPGRVTTTFAYTSLHQALAAKPRAGAEGLCVRYRDEPRIVKIKQDDYVRLHRIVTGLSERSVWEHMGTGGKLHGLLDTLPDELHEWTREVWDRIQATADAIAAEALATHDALLADLPPGWTRGDYAARAKTHGPLTPLLFQLLDGKDTFGSIHRTLKPAGDTRAKVISEAVA